MSSNPISQSDDNIGMETKEKVEVKKEKGSSLKRNKLFSPKSQKLDASEEGTLL